VAGCNRTMQRCRMDGTKPWMQLKNIEDIQRPGKPGSEARSQSMRLCYVTMWEIAEVDASDTVRTRPYIARSTIKNNRSPARKGVRCDDAAQCCIRCPCNASAIVVAAVRRNTHKTNNSDKRGRTIVPHPSPRLTTACKCGQCCLAAALGTPSFLHSETQKTTKGNKTQHSIKALHPRHASVAGA
jgi:hypothetical protein